MNKPNKKKAVKVRHPDDSVTFSIRMPWGDLESIQKTAEKFHFSVNQFFVQSALASVEMIDAPEGGSMPLPSIVASARFLKYNRPSITLS